MRNLIHNFVVHSNESARRKSGRLGLDLFACFWDLFDKKMDKATRHSKCRPWWYVKTRTKVTKYNLYPISYGYPWTSPISTKCSLVLNNILYQHWIETQIKGHHLGKSDLIFKPLQKTNWWCNSYQSTWCHNYLLNGSRQHCTQGY